MVKITKKFRIKNDKEKRRWVAKELAKFHADMKLYESLIHKLSATSKKESENIIIIQMIKKKRIKDLIKDEDNAMRRHENYYLKLLLEKGYHEELQQELKEVRLKRKGRKCYSQAFRLEEIDGTIFYIFHDEQAFQDLIRVCNQLVRIARNPFEIKKDIRLYQQLREELPHPGDKEYQDWERAHTILSF
jgi:hypothetical protein